MAFLHGKLRPLVHRVALPWLLIVPGLLAIAAIVVLTVHSDLNIAALYSQCHAHSRIPALSRIPVLGAPSCFLVSFFQLANDAARSLARMGVVLAFVAGLLTASLVESARLCNAASWVVRRPTVPWLVFNLVGGALVWDLVIVPSFLRRAKEVQRARESGRAERVRQADPEIDREVRSLSSQVEVVAIPVAVALGFVVPSVAMLVLNEPISIIVWLFFPLWVAAVRYLVKLVGLRIVTDPEPFHLESNRVAFVAVYAVPALCSVVAHVLFIWNLFSREDRKEMTRSMIKFIEIDFLIIGATVLYWLLVEAGVLVSLALVGASILLGPGAGLSLSWYLREKAIENYEDGTDADEEEAPGGDSDEQTPLLR